MFDNDLYKTLHRFGGVETLIIRDFGGSVGDPVAAVIRVNGHAMFRILAPRHRATWSPLVEQRFRHMLRTLAKSVANMRPDDVVAMMVLPAQGTHRTFGWPVEWIEPDPE